MRKAVEQVGNYTVKERPTGGWSVSVTGVAQPISIHETKLEAMSVARCCQTANMTELK